MYYGCYFLILILIVFKLNLLCNTLLCSLLEYSFHIVRRIIPLFCSLLLSLSLSHLYIYFLCFPWVTMQDSPVFNYINSLSPIKPVKSVNIAQTFNSLTFASLPSVFTSPHVNLHKETRFLRR